MTYRVTIAIPIYNVEKYIEKCARSLFEQTFDSIQYIFINDCTPDNSIDILQKIIEQYPHRKKDIQIIHHEKNKGLAGARITGINAAQGEYILQIDSDDYIDIKTVELMYNKATEDNADIVVCDMTIVWSKRIKVFPQIYSPGNIEYTKLLLNTKAMPGVVNKLIRKSLYTNNDILPVEGINMGEDYCTTPRLAYYANKISKIDLPLYYYSQINENAYTKKYTEKSADSLIRAIGILDDFFKNTPESNIFEESLLQAKLIKKISLIRFMPKEYRKEMALLFPESNKVINITPLPIHEKIIIKLVNKKLFTLLSIFLFLFDNALEFLQILKGRRLK